MIATTSFQKSKDFPFILCQNRRNKTTFKPMNKEKKRKEENCE